MSRQCFRRDQWAANTLCHYEFCPLAAVVIRLSPVDQTCALTGVLLRKQSLEQALWQSVDRRCNGTGRYKPISSLQSDYAIPSGATGPAFVQGVSVLIMFNISSAAMPLTVQEAARIFSSRGR